MCNRSIHDLPDAFSLADMASALGISKSSGYRWAVKAGLATQVGGRIVVFKDELLKTLENSKMVPSKKAPEYAQHLKSEKPIEYRKMTKNQNCPINRGQLPNNLKGDPK
jgi:hypothetical protein